MPLKSFEIREREREDVTLKEKRTAGKRIIQSMKHTKGIKMY